MFGSEVLERSLTKRREEVTKPTNVDGLILEAWAQGFMVGALIIMSCITAANMRRGVLLHKLILVELLFGIWHGFFIFNHAPVYGWYLSVSAIFLNISWSLHNVIAWMKNKPFLSRKVSLFYITSVALVQPYWVIEIYANFTYFNNINDLFLHTRPYEALFRDPWWIFTVCSLFYNIKSRYELTIHEILRISPRFAVMLMAMVLSICFLVTDICSVTDVFKSALPIGINPFWKLSFVFKCLTDSVILDDFKTALDRLRAFKISRLGSFAVEGGATDRSWRKGLTEAHHPWAAMEALPTKDGFTVEESKNAFGPATTTRVVSQAYGPERGESATGLTTVMAPISTWDEIKTTTTHLEDPKETQGPGHDMEESLVGTGITSRKGLREPERSWLRESGGDQFRTRRRGGRGDVETGYESDSSDEKDKSVAVVGIAK